jgi:HAMP domain-containing protein
MFNHLKLAPKFTLLLLLVFICGSGLGGLVLSRSLQQQVEANVTAEGVVLMESMQAVRRYTNQQVSPLLEGAMGADEFWPETIPAYSARRVFELMQKQGTAIGDFHYTYKEAVLNPTNPDDRVDAFEAALTQDLLRQPALTQLSGFRELPNQGSVFYSALPIRIQEQSCLQCHGAPEVAPPAMLARYGRENGFDWPLNEVIGTQIVYVPADEVARTAQRAFSSVIGVFLGGFAIALLCLNLLLKPLVVQPIQNLARISQKLAADDIQSDGELQAASTQKLAGITQRRDELGHLGRVFQTMMNEVVARQQRLQQQIQVLKIEIDDKRKAQQIDEITNTDYFQSLQQKAREIRDRKQQQE